MSEAGKAPLRVALLSAHLSRAGGGVFASICDLALALAALPGMEVEIFGPAPAAGGGDLPKTIRARLFPQLGPAGYGYAAGLGKGLIEAAPDLAHVHGLWTHPSVAATAFSNETGRPRIVSPHGMLDSWALRNSLWKKRLAAAAFERAHLSGAACLHALCAAEAESMRAYGLKAPICVIPNGVQPVERKAPAEVRDGSKKTLLYLGRLHPKKGLPDLLRAWKQVRRVPWHLRVVGWDEAGHQAELRRLAVSLGLDSSVSFQGPVFDQQKRLAIDDCDGLILPSLSEGLPMAVLESWAAAKPVLMTPQCNLPEGFDACAAIRIEAGVEPIAQGLTEFFEMTDAAREEMGRRGFALANGRFAWPAIAAEMKRVYEWVCGRGDRPPSVLAT